MAAFRLSNITPSSTLDRDGVQLIFLQSASDSGDGTLGVMTAVSVSQVAGHFPVLKIELKMVVTGLASRCWWFLTTLGRMSLSTEELGFFASLRSLATSSTESGALRCSGGCYNH